jgi:SAM-dependent methyltransferase
MNRLLKRALEMSGLEWFTLSRREKVAWRFLRGDGLEVGALSTPLRVFHGARVKYVDNTTREANIAKFPELSPDSLVEPHYLCDGFTLEAVATASHDFLVANHVLEHAPNPVAVLRAWLRVLRPGGVVYVTVPVVGECFDRGRPVTAVEHLFEDFEIASGGRDDAMRERNKAHYTEWLTISLPAINRDQGRRAEALSPEALAREVDDWNSRNVEIHFHTFTAGSFRQLLERVVASDTRGASVAAIVDSKYEVIAVVRAGTLPVREM